MPQESEELLMTVAFKALADDSPLQDFQGREQGCRPIPLVVVRHRAAAALFDRQARLRAVERWDLALLTDTQHHRLLRRVQIQPRYVGQLLQELGIPR